MKPKELRSEIDQLVLYEKLLLVEDIWDSIATNNAELPMPEWQKKKLDRRYAEYQKGSLDLHDWKAVHEELRDKYKWNYATPLAPKMALSLHLYGTKDNAED